MTRTKRILVIDDNEDLLLCMKEAFAPTDYSIATAQNGNKGIEMFSSEKYDLVYLDLQMPEINGVETLKKLKEINAKVPVVITTSFHGEYFEELKEIENQGREFEIMHKPTTAEQIILVADSLLKSF